MLNVPKYTAVSSPTAFLVKGKRVWDDAIKTSFIIW